MVGCGQVPTGPSLRHLLKHRDGVRSDVRSVLREVLRFSEMNQSRNIIFENDSRDTLYLKC